MAIGQDIVFLQMLDQRVKAFVAGQDVKVSLAVSGGLDPDEISEDEVEGIPPRKTCFHQSHLRGVFQELLNQVHRQFLVSLAQHQDDDDGPARD